MKKKIFLTDALIASFLLIVFLMLTSSCRKAEPIYPNGQPSIGTAAPVSYSCLPFMGFTDDGVEVYVNGYKVLYCYQPTHKSNLDWRDSYGNIHYVYVYGTETDAYKAIHSKWLNTDMTLGTFNVSISNDEAAGVCP